ncbi:MAG: hypothetical protein IIV49_00355, partial [Alistipes sp.]|nr:hypothetical protein [Alistipes sp.]
MKIFRLIVTVLLVLGSALTVGMAVMDGMEAPESSKITNSTPLVQNVATVEEGIQELGNVFAAQIGEDMLDEDGIVEEQAKLDETLNVHIPAYEAKVAAKAEAKAVAEQEIAQLGELKSLNAKQKKQLEAANAVVADYKATADTLQIYRNNVVIMQDNIAASIKANKNTNKLQYPNKHDVGLSYISSLPFVYSNQNKDCISSSRVVLTAGESTSGE